MQRSEYELLSSLSQRGVKVWLDTGQLRFKAPKGVLSQSELNELRALRKEIIELLKGAELASDLPIEPRGPACPIPLTALQLNWRKWFVEGLGELSKRICTAMRVVGPLNVDFLRASVESAVKRHESLRTRVVVVGGIPRQHVDAFSGFMQSVTDLSEVVPQDTEKEVRRLSEEFANEQIDLSVGPLFAVKLFRLSDLEHVLILGLDHMISDGISTSVLLEEMWTAYDQIAHGVPILLSKLQLQFADYAVWQQRIRGAWLKEHQAYWKERLIGAPAIRIPEDKLTEAPDPTIAILEISLGHTVSTGLRELARRERTLLPLVVLTIYLIVMSEWCKQRDLVLLFLSNGRYRPELQNMVGFIANLLYLRSELTDEDSFVTLLRRVTREFQVAYEHQDFGWVPDLFPECTTELVFNWLPADPVKSFRSCQQKHGHILEIRPFPLRVVWPKVRFGTWFSDAPTGVEVLIAYQTDLFARTTIERFGKNLVAVAEQLLRRPFDRIVSMSTAEVDVASA
jgi:hypothetical protein